MPLHQDPSARLFFSVILGLLIVSSLIGWGLRKAKGDSPTLINLTARIRAWWVMVAVFTLALSLGRIGAIGLTALMSFFALREFVSLTPTRRADYRGLLWMFFVILPFHYATVLAGWYGMMAVFIPVYAFLLLPLRQALAGDTDDFLARTARLQWAVWVCVYCVSHLPALLDLEIIGFDGRNALLLCWFVTVVQISDVLQYVWGKTCGRRKVAPTVSPSKTVEGLVGGVLSAVGVGVLLRFLTPFGAWEAAGMGLAVTLAGFGGGLVMSAIKRDRGVKDFGDLLPGHGGMLDRIDSLCFAAPLFFHLTRWFHTP